MSAPSNQLDQVRQRLLAFDEFLRWRELMLRRFADPAIDKASEASATDSEPNGAERRDPAESSDSVVEALRGVQKTMLRHPVAVQAGFSALAAEGRRFAQTDEGQRWRRRLEGSAELEQWRMLWEALSLTLVDDDSEAMLPSAFLELFVRTAASGNLEQVATELGLPFLGRSAASPQDRAATGKGSNR